MSKPIEILPNVYGVKVPSDYDTFDIMDKESLQIAIIVSQNNTLNSFPIVIPDGKWKIIGTLTKDEISFDVTDIYEKFSTIETAEKKFRSALPEEIYFENPNSHPSDIEPTNRNHYEALKDAYQTAQENITEKLLILQKLTDNVKI